MSFSFASLSQHTNFYPIFEIRTNDFLPFVHTEISDLSIHG